MINMLPRTSRSFTWAHREVSSPWKGNCSEGTLVQADGRLARGAGETPPQASTPRTLHLTVTFDQREQVHPIKRNAHTGWLWCPYFLQTPTQSFPSGTASQTWEGLDITTRCLQGLSGQLSTPYFLFSLIQLTLHSGRGTPHGSEAPEANGKGTILPSLPLIFHARLSPHLTPLLNSPLVPCCLRSLFTLWWSPAVPTKLEYFSQMTVKRYKER